MSLGLALHHLNLERKISSSAAPHPYVAVCPACPANLLTLNSSKTQYLLIGLPQQLNKIINTSSLIPTHSARNLGFIFDEHLTFSDQISALSKSCYYHIRELRCIRPYLDFRTASTIATSIVHSKLDYCNSLYYNLPQSQIKRLQNIQNSLARAVTRTPKSSHITPVLKSLHWLRINGRIKYKILSLTYKVWQLTNVNNTTTWFLINLGTTYVVDWSCTLHYCYVESVFIIFLSFRFTSFFCVRHSLVLGEIFFVFLCMETVKDCRLVISVVKDDDDGGWRARRVATRSGTC